MSALVRLNVGGRHFASHSATFNESPLLAALLSDTWSDTTPRLDGLLFLDRDPALFGHILQFLRTDIPPVFWLPGRGFDLSLYASLLGEADYFQLHTLADWIREAKYAYTVRVTPSMSRELVRDCEQGLVWHVGTTTKHFDTGTLATSSNSGRSTTYWKRIHIETTSLHPPECLHPVNSPMPPPETV